MTLIVGISAKKKGGKDTVANVFKEVNNKEAFRPFSDRKVCKIYHFADKLKEFCRDYFLIDAQLLWGTDEDKNTRIPYILWQNMPGYENFIVKKIHDAVTNFTVTGHSFIQKNVEMGIKRQYYGTMSVREILQYWGTEVCRKAWSSIWVQSCMRQIDKDGHGIALVADMRFPDEAEAIKQRKGFTVRLTRNIAGNDIHASEISLDDYKFDHVIDNANMTLEATQKAFNNYALGLL